MRSGDDGVKNSLQVFAVYNGHGLAVSSSAFEHFKPQIRFGQEHLDKLYRLILPPSSITTISKPRTPLLQVRSHHLPQNVQHRLAPAHLISQLLLGGPQIISLLFHRLDAHLAVKTRELRLAARRPPLRQHGQDRQVAQLVDQEALEASQSRGAGAPSQRQRGVRGHAWRGPREHYRRCERAAMILLSRRYPGRWTVPGDGGKADPVAAKLRGIHSP